MPQQSIEQRPDVRRQQGLDRAGQATVMLIDGAQDERGQGKIPGDFNFLSDQHVEGAGENRLRFQVRLDQARDFRAEHRPAVRLEGAKAIKVQDRCLMPRHGLLWVVAQINPFQGDSDPIGGVGEITLMKGRDRVESLGGLEVATAQEKDQLIAGRAQSVEKAYQEAVLNAAI